MSSAAKVGNQDGCVGDQLVSLLCKEHQEEKGLETQAWA